jgi:hypothetical protein
VNRSSWFAGWARLMPRSVPPEGAVMVSCAALVLNTPHGIIGVLVDFLDRRAASCDISNS